MCNVNGSDWVLHSHGYLPWQITPSEVSNKPWQTVQRYEQKGKRVGGARKKLALVVVRKKETTTTMSGIGCHVFSPHESPRPFIPFLLSNSGSFVRVLQTEKETVYSGLYDTMESLSWTGREDQSPPPRRGSWWSGLCRERGTSRPEIVSRRPGEGGMNGGNHHKEVGD
jgi:hypothetical protein